MTAFQGAVDATFPVLGVDPTYTTAGGEPVPVRVIARRPDTVVGFVETRIHAETATFELRASEVVSPRPGDQLTIVGETFGTRLSRSGAIRIGWCGILMQGPHESSPVLPALGSPSWRYLNSALR